jgi:hypothetical protein
MAKELEYCEFDDLKQVGGWIQMQLDFKMLNKEGLMFASIYASLHIQDLENRREKAKYVKEQRKNLIILRPEELECSDEYYNKQVYPRIFEHATIEERTPFLDAIKNNEEQRKKGYMLHVVKRNKVTQEMPYLMNAVDYMAAKQELEKREAEFNKLPNIFKVFAPKHRGPDPEAPLVNDFVRPTDLNDTERGSDWQKGLLLKFREIAAQERAEGREIDAQHIKRSRDMERHKREEEERMRAEAERREKERLEVEAAENARLEAEERARAEAAEREKLIPAHVAPSIRIKPSRLPKTRERGIER